MSGIAAIIRFDGGPVERGAIEAMTTAMDYRGPDGIAHWARGPVALGHCMLHTTTESLEEAQPLANDDDSLILVMDGWLSNWEELRSELLSRGAKLRNRSDAELVLRAYEAWGEDCPKHIDGDFAFLVWDTLKQEAFCARDHASMRPLYYHWDGNRLVVASDIAGVLAAPDVEKRPNRSMMAQYMGGEWYSRDETIWCEIKRALPAHWMRFSARGAASECYWSPPLEVSIRYKRDEDYFDHYRELFADCTRRSCRSHAPVGCEISGGLDSSAVFAMAHHLQRAGQLPAPSIKGYTLLFDEQNSAADEIAYGRAVAEHVGAEVREIPAFFPDLSWFETRVREDQDLPTYPSGAMMINLSAAVAADGCRVVLNGNGGDEWAWGSPLYYAEHLAAGNLAEFYRSFRDDLACMGLRDTAWRAWRHGIAPCLPRPLLDLRHRLRAAAGQRPDWLSDDMQRLLNERRAAEDRSALFRIPARARREMCTTLDSSLIGMSRDFGSRQLSRGGLERRSPMYMRRFIEFAFATPEQIKLRGHTARYTHRHALAGLMPDIVANRQTKADFSIAFTHQLDSMRNLFVNVLPKIDAGTLNQSGVEKLYDRYTASRGPGTAIWQLWGIFGCVNVLGLVE